MLKKISIFVFLLTATVVYGQKENLDKGNKKYKALAFIEAQKIYLKLAEDGYATAEVLAKLGDTYYFNDELNKAHKWYEQLFTQYENNVKPEYFFRYAQSLKSVNRYDEADRLMAKFNTFKGFDSRSQLYSEEPNYLQIIDFQSGRFEIANTKKINSYSVDFGPAFYASQNQIVYATSRDSGSLVNKRHSWNGQAFLQLYTADVDETGKLSNPKKFSSRINTKYHESTPAISSDGETMYFASQQFPSLGGYDIFISKKGEDGEWQEPTNVGFPINTVADELGMFVTTDGKTAYFCSNKLEGIGGWDLYSFF